MIRKKQHSTRLLLLLAAALLVAIDVAPGASLRLTATIPLPGVRGRLDHLAVDLAAHRLFVCALGNDSLEVIDLEKAKRIHSIVRLAHPQGVGYAPESNHLFVSNADGGTCEVYDGKSFASLGRVELKDDADNIRYEAGDGRIYVGYGEGGITVLDSRTGKSISSIVLPAHPEAFVLETKGSRIFANIPRTGRVAVLDREKGRVLATWKIQDARANFPIALDEAYHRLFVGCRSPASIVVLDSDSGKVVASFAIAGDVDDLFYDQARHRLYAISGEGKVDVIDQWDRDSYSISSIVETAAGTRTGLFVPELNSLFVAVPANGNHCAEIRCFKVD